jgi:histidinol-phosphatase
MTPGRDYNGDMHLAHVLADQADSISMDRFKALDLKVDTKPDLTPVTDADRAVEEQLRITLSRARTRDAVLGEELGTTGHGQRRWVLDPIDGTKNYVRGIPVYGTLIALQRDGRTDVGVVSAPALGRRWWAATGEGAYADGHRIHVSKVARIEDAHLSYASLTGWDERGLGAQFGTLARRFWRTRAFGDFWQHMLVAEGAIDVALEPEVSLWDLAALQVIVEEAGGRFTDLDGRAWPEGGNAVSSNGVLHDAVLAALQP